MQAANQSSQPTIGAKKRYTATLVSGITTALDQKDLEKALIKGRLRGRADIEIIAKSAEQFEEDRQAQLTSAIQQINTLSKQQQKSRNDKRQEISQEIFNYHLEHIKYSYYKKSILALSTQTQTHTQNQSQTPIPATSSTSRVTATQSIFLQSSQSLTTASSKPKILLHYHQVDEAQLGEFITKFKTDLEKIGITQDQIMVMSELATELTASNISQFQQVVSLVGSNFKESLAKSASNKTLSDQKLEQQLELFDKQSVINLPVLALGEYTPELTRGFGGKSILILDLTQKYQDSIFNNNYQENFFSLAKTIYNITDLANSPKEVKEVNDFFAQQRISYYQKQKYLLDNKADLRIDRIIRENRYGLQTILEEIDEEIHQESKLAINASKTQNYQKLSEILKEKNINISEKETDGNTILHHLTKNPNDQEAQKLITKILDDYPDIDVNNRLNNQDSLIHIIVKNLSDIRDPELQKIIKRLVNKGSQSHHKNLENKSALEIFREKFTKFEIEDQIFNEITNPDLYIEVARLEPDIEKIKTLLADPDNHQINCTNAQGENLLIRAVRDEEVELVEFLLKQPQIDINHRDRNNLTALDYSDTVDKVESREIDEGNEIKEIKKTIATLLKEAIANKKSQSNLEQITTEIEEKRSDFNSMSASIASDFDQQHEEVSLTLLSEESTTEATISATENLSTILTPQNVITFAQAIENLNEEYEKDNEISKTFEQTQQLTNWLPQSLIATANSNNDIKSSFIATIKNQIAIEDSKDIYDLTKIDIEFILANLDNITIASSSPASAPAPATASTSATSSLDHNIFSEEEQQKIANCSSLEEKEQEVKKLLKSKKDQRATFLKEQSALLLREFCFALAETLPPLAKDKSLFISYAWTQQEIVDFVRNHLEKDLHEAGFNVTLDTRDLSVGANIIEFERKISQTDYIVMVADPSYKERSDQLLGGVGDEAKFLEKRLEAEIAKAQIKSQSQSSLIQSQSQLQGSNQECFLNILLRSGNATTSIPEYVHRAINQTSAQTQKMIRTYDATRSQDDELTIELQQERDQVKRKDIIEKMRKTESIFENRYAQSLIDLLEEIYQHHLTKQQFENLKYGYYHSLNQLLEKTPIEIDALQQQEELNKQQRQRLIEQQLTPKQLIIEQLIAFIKDNQRTAEIIKIIRLQGEIIDFNYQDDEDNSMLHYAAQTGNEKVFLEILKQQNINPHLKNKFNESPQDIAKKYDQTHLANLYKPDEIIFAVENNQIERLQILIDVFKNDVNQLTQDKENPLTLLMLASAYGSTDAALILIAKGGDINQVATGKDNESVTPLHYACANGHTQTALTLIARGADIHQVTTGLLDGGQTPLSYACENGHTETAIALIEAGADTNKIEKEKLNEILSQKVQYDNKKEQLTSNIDIISYNTQKKIYRKQAQESSLEQLLIKAAKQNNIIRVKALIKAGGDINQADENGQTPLHFTCQKGHTEIALALINAGANINQAATSGYKVAGRTPLSFACEKGHTETALALIKAGADINLAATGKDYTGMTPLHFACQYGRSDVALALIKEGVDINQAATGQYCAGMTPLHFTCEEGHTELALILIERGADINQEATGGIHEGKTPLHFACENGRSDVALALIARGVDINQATTGEWAGQTSLSYAWEKGHTETALALIEKGADINQVTTEEDEEGRTLLSFACQKGRTEIVLALIEAGADINKADKKGKTLLSFACEKGHTETALALIDAGADIHKATTGEWAGRTPLHFACEEGHTETALALIDAGADINQATTGKDNAGMTPLHFTCQYGHTETALALIKEGANVNQVATGKWAGITPLHDACVNGHTETALALIARGADINQVATGEYNAGRTPLSYACEEGHTETALALIKEGADIHQATTGEWSGKTPLSFACQNGHTKTALGLIEAGADINKATTGENYAGQTPLHFACKRGHTETALALINEGADINQAATGQYCAGMTPLHFTCEEGHTELALALINEGANINQVGTGECRIHQKTPLHFACENGHTELALALINEGADINQAATGQYSAGMTPLHFACKRGHTETALALIKEGSDINQTATILDEAGMTPLSFACSRGLVEVALVLIDKGADINQAITRGDKAGRTPLSYACEKGHTETALALIKEGADINQADKDGQTPLSFACQKGRSDVALALIKEGADIHQADKYGQTPLSFAWEKGHTETALALIEKGADINQVATEEDEEGRTPLHFACKKGRTEIVLALIEAGADINKADKKGKTLLSYACENGHTEIALALIEAGADINQATTGIFNAGQTPLSFACENGHSETALALIKEGADIHQAATGWNNKDQTPLFLACASGLTEVALALIVEGANINQVATQKGIAGQTPLSFACQEGRSDVALALIKEGADINLANKEGKTPLSFACKEDHNQTALTLIKAGANINQAATGKYIAGRTPLSFACENGHSETVFTLIQAGADINQAATGEYNKGMTPLSFACMEGHNKIALALIEAGADTSKIEKDKLNKLLTQKKQHGYDKDDIKPLLVGQNQEITINKEAITTNQTEIMFDRASDLVFTAANDVFVNNSIQIISKEQIISSTNQIESSVRQDLFDERENFTPNPSCSTGLAIIVRAKINDGCCNVM